VEQVKRAVFAGASFISSPGFIPGVVEYCLKNGITVLPAICTPTELAHAGEYGLSLVKFFPAEQAGGLPMLKLLAAPFDSIEYIPTGGVSPGNVADYLSFDKVAACGGSWMLKDELIMEGRYKEILKLVRHAVRLTALKPAVQKLSS
jgi:2-dehydro-3-deoxyphosphogluconate aldolase/(4S)-4-hydroxy-2-oxoglutarate aldolase